MAGTLDIPDRLTSDLESCQYVTVTAGPEIIQQKILTLVGPFFMIASSTSFVLSDRVRESYISGVISNSVLRPGSGPRGVLNPNNNPTTDSVIRYDNRAVHHRICMIPGATGGKYPLICWPGSD